MKTKLQIGVECKAGIDAAPHDDTLYGCIRQSNEQSNEQSIEENDMGENEQKFIVVVFRRSIFPLKQIEYISMLPLGGEKLAKAFEWAKSTFDIDFFGISIFDAELFLKAAGKKQLGDYLRLKKIQKKMLALAISEETNSNV